MSTACSALQQQLLEKLKASWPLAGWRGQRILVAVSGGSDSMALARLLGQLAPDTESRLLLAHFDHGWRADSARDAQLVRELAKQMDWPFLLGHASHGGPCSEERARDERYRFLHDSARQQGARCVVTAHTQDDQAETILDRILRGSGLRGLAGIPRLRKLDEDIVLVRPLLCCRREELQRYLRECGQQWHQDSSNQDRQYTRNRIRHELIPLLVEDYHSGAERSLLQLAELAQETQSFIAARVDRLMADAVDVRLTDQEEQVVIRFEALKHVEPLLVRELLIEVWCQQGWPRKEMGMREWKQLAALAGSDPTVKRQILPGNIDVVRRDKKSGGELELTRRRKNSVGEA